MSIYMDPLATKQAFCHLNIETEAKTKLEQATTAFYKEKLTESANLFLESWRILQNEYESNLYERPDSLRRQQQVHTHLAWENKERMLLSFTALHDLAKACYRNTEEYRDENGKCKLKVHALRHGWLGNTTTEILEFEEEIEEKVEYKISPKGSGIAHVLLLKDPLGRLLDEADSFNDAASIIAHICSLQVACVSNSSQDLLRGYEFIRSGLGLITKLTLGRQKLLAIAVAKGYNSFDQIQGDKNNPGREDKEGRKILVIKMEEKENKKNSLKEEADEEGRKNLVIKMEEKDDEKTPEELVQLLEQFHIAPSLWNGREQPHAKPYKGLDQFHVMAYKGKAFEQLREDNNDNEQEVEKREGEIREKLVIKWKEEEETKLREEEMKLKEENELVELFERFQVITRL
jgi:hypothetical protein